MVHGGCSYVAGIGLALDDRHWTGIGLALDLNWTGIGQASDLSVVHKSFPITGFKKHDNRAFWPDYK